MAHFKENHGHATSPMRASKLQNPRKSGNHCSIRRVDIQKKETRGTVFCAGVDVLSTQSAFPHSYAFEELLAKAINPRFLELSGY